VALTSFTSVCTLRAGVEPHRARHALSALPAGAHSPFAASARTHFGRLQVVDELQVHRRRALARPVVVFSADVDGDVGSYLVEVLGASADAFAWVLRLCADAPDDANASDFAERGAAYLREHELAVGLPYVNSPGPTAVEIRRAVQRRRQLAGFAVANQGRAPADLRAAFRAEFLSADDREAVRQEAT
jgi:hypothetical protein